MYEVLLGIVRDLVSEKENKQQEIVSRLYAAVEDEYGTETADLALELFGRVLEHEHHGIDSPNAIGRDGGGILDIDTMEHNQDEEHPIVISKGSEAERERIDNETVRQDGIIDRPKDKTN